MRILHTIEDLYIQSGGTTICLYDLLSGLNDIGCPTDIISLNDGIHEIIGKNENWMKFLPDDTLTPFCYSAGMKRFLKQESDYDLYHTNGLWLYCNHVTAKTAKMKKKPYVVSPHGMLYPQALSRSSFKKKIMRFALFDKDLKDATCIHATCTQEMEHIRRAGFENPIAVIPNPVRMMDEIPVKPQKKRLGFLGRLHQRKNVEVLLHAFAGIRETDAELLIIGSGDIKYETYLKELAKELSLDNVIFEGFVSGIRKYELLSSLSAMFVPSDFENFGMIIPEALMMKVPVMASLGTPWEDLNKYNCGWWVHNDVDTVTKVMRQALSASDQEREAMGKNGRRLVLDNYTVDVIAQKMNSLYTWILQGGDKPDFVYQK